MWEGKDWRVDLAPLLLFGLIVLSKSYFLVDYISANEQLWVLLSDSGDLSNAGPGVGYYLTGQFSYIAYYLTSFAFDALVFFSFLIRRRASARPKGFWENIFPLVTVFVPVIGFTLMFIPAVRALLPHYPEAFLHQLAEWTPAFPFYLNLAGLLIGLFGAAFSIWALAHLGASFGLRTAVRTLVTSGPYRRIRHPLYFGEIFHILGIAILAATPAAMYLFVGAVTLQVVRARIEERKFLATVPDYAQFRRNTGFLWPKFSRKADASSSQQPGSVP